MGDKIKLVIDPGHGGADPGAVNNKLGLKEKDIVLQVANILHAIFCTHRRYDVMLTRLTDGFVELQRRTDLANYRGAHLISLHCNAAESPEAQGAETWCFSETNAAGAESEGHKLARKIQDWLGGGLFADRGVTAIYDRSRGEYIYRPLWVLRATRMPAVLVEMGFLSNFEDAGRYAGDGSLRFKTDLAYSLFEAIDTYFIDTYFLDKLDKGE